MTEAAATTQGATTAAQPLTNDGSSLPACFAKIVAEHRHRPAIAAGRWLPNYDELDAASNRLANTLCARGARPDDRVAILMAHDGAQIAAALAVLKAGCIGVVLNPSHPAAALAETIAHAEARLLVVDRAHRERAGALAPVHDIVDAETADGDLRDPGIAVDADQTAFLVYTSGSTGRPKAIMRTHALLRQNAARHARGVDVAADDRLALLASLSGGQGIGVMWTALLAGAALCPFPVADRGFAALADWLDDHRVTTFISSASVFRGFAKALPAGRRFPLIRAVRIASEMATAEDFEAFRRHFPSNARFVHSYGCSEVGNVAQHVVAPGERVAAGRLPVGRPAGDLTVTIVGDDGRPLPAGETGTIVVSGRHLAAGYWREPALTAERFAAVPGAPSLRSYRSGDLGRFDAAGRLAIVGRSDSQVKIRGQRVDLSAVEAAMRRIAGIEQATACAVPQGDGELRLVAYVVATADAPATIAQLRRKLRAALPRAMVPTAFVALDVLPLTPHGKIDRAALIARHGLPARSAAGDAPRDGIEAQVAAIWAEAFELGAIGRDDDFFALGGDSLTAAIVGARIHDALGIEIELAAFAAHPTLAAFAAGIAARIARTGAGADPPLRRIARDGVLPLSFTQQRLWTYSQTPDSFARYRHNWRGRLVGPLDRDALRLAFDAVVARHELLRTRYPDVEGAQRADIAEATPADLPFLDLAGRADASVAADAFAAEVARQVCDIRQLPLLRLALVRIADDEHMLYRISHHVLGDGESWRVFMDELEAGYAAIRNGEPPRAADPDALQYVDYADWQRRLLDPGGPAARRALAWWRTVLREPWPDFAPRFRRPVPVDGLTAAAGVRTIEVAAETTRRLRALGREAGTTTFATLLAAVAAVLAAECARDRIVIGTYQSLRNRVALERMLGDFTMPAAIPLAIGPELAFRDWLRRVQTLASEAVAHAAIPAESLVPELAAAGLTMPAVAVTLALRAGQPAQRFERLELRREPHLRLTMPWGLAISVAPGRSASHLTAAFDAGVYEPAGVAAMLDRLARLLDHAGRTPEAPLAALVERSAQPAGRFGALRRYATRLMSFGGPMSSGNGQT